MYAVRETGKEADRMKRSEYRAERLIFRVGGREIIEKM
jgi:hypothetical protein